MTALAWPSLADLGRWARWAVPRWSVPAAMRAIRAVIVICGLFALAHNVIGNAQIATFCAFGGFATLVLSSFAGTWRDKLLAHLALALAGSALLTIATIVSSSTEAGSDSTAALQMASLPLMTSFFNARMWVKRDSGFAGKCIERRAGLGCLNSFPRMISGVPPGLVVRNRRWSVAT